MAKRTKQHDWNVSVTFVRFGSEREKDDAYRVWVRCFIRSKATQLQCDDKRQIVASGIKTEED
jgi:hypothetical protein